MNLIKNYSKCIHFSQCFRYQYCYYFFEAKLYGQNLHELYVMMAYKLVCNTNVMVKSQTCKGPF